MEAGVLVTDGLSLYMGKGKDWLVDVYCDSQWMTERRNKQFSLKMSGSQVSCARRGVYLAMRHMSTFTLRIVGGGGGGGGGRGWGCLGTK